MFPIGEFKLYMEVKLFEGTVTGAMFLINLNPILYMMSNLLVAQLDNPGQPAYIK